MRVGAVIVAAGRGVRAGGGTPKQWRPLCGATSAEFSLRAFSDHPDVSALVLVVHPDDRDADLLPRSPACDVVTGGDTRSASVLAGLKRLQHSVEAVLVHDAARPCVTPEIIDGVIAALKTTPAAAPAIPVVDALWTGADGKVTGTTSREGLFRAQTPQGFHLSEIIAAHQAFQGDAADDVEIARAAGLEVAITAGDEDNLKITTAADFERAAAILKARNGY